ncbi:hypothetical protein DS835_01305 [Lactobacillus bombicola]|jgi:acyl-CoA hydrolase|uniref:HotDog ACOT-type domain-containing protein n=2 Tax=Lactobacillus bombicola TaxID=1505723 RepID=A0A396SZP5_9LACO|nr:hypothetical protein DS835_01305 [Lactobacillus bombicola]
MYNKFFKRSMADYFVTPQMLNHMNITHGGTILTRLDSAMGLFANSYAKTETLTGRIDRVNFYRPSSVGDHLSFCLTLLKTTKRTMTIYAAINRLSLDDRQTELIGEAVLTYVAVDAQLRPIQGQIEPYQVSDKTEEEFIHSLKDRLGL